MGSVSSAPSASTIQASTLVACALGVTAIAFQSMLALKVSGLALQRWPALAHYGNFGAALACTLGVVVVALGKSSMPSIQEAASMLFDNSDDRWATWAQKALDNNLFPEAHTLSKTAFLATAPVDASARPTRNELSSEAYQSFLEKVWDIAHTTTAPTTTATSDVNLVKA